MVTPESRVKKAVRVMLDAHGAYYFSPATGGYGRSGVPDFIVCYRGRFIAIECKAGDNVPTALQDRELDRIRKMGGHALWVNEKNVDDVHELLKLINGETKCQSS